MPAEYVPTTQDIIEVYTWGIRRAGRLSASDRARVDAESKALFYRWLADHDAEVREAEVARYWGTCSGCGIQKVTCDQYATDPHVIKCCPDCEHVTAVLAPEPHVVTSVEELEALPCPSVVMDAAGWVLKKSRIVEADRDEDEGRPAWWLTGNADEFPVAYIRLPATVLTPAPAPRADDERALDEVMRQRDEYMEMCDRLAYAIAPVEVIGEHSSGNDPWQNALDHLAAPRAVPQAISVTRERLAEFVEGLLWGTHEGCMRINCADCVRRDIARRMQSEFALLNGGSDERGGPVPDFRYGANAARPEVS